MNITQMGEYALNMADMIQFTGHVRNGRVASYDENLEFTGFCVIGAASFSSLRAQYTPQEMGEFYLSLARWITPTDYPEAYSLELWSDRSETTEVVEALRGYAKTQFEIAAA